MDFIPAFLIAILVICYLIVFAAIMWVCLLIHPVVAIIVGASILAITAGSLLGWYAWHTDW